VSNDKGRAQSRYEHLRTYRTAFLDTAVECSRLTLPYLIQEEDVTNRSSHLRFPTPWQSVGAKGVVALASKLMLALMPVQTSFFKLEVQGKALEGLPPGAKQELDQSLAIIEKATLSEIAGTNDRVVVHQALKHLVAGGNALIYLGPDTAKLYPLNRYVVDRDGDDNLTEIVTKECISRKILIEKYPKYLELANLLQYKQDETDTLDVDVYTHVTRADGKWRWHQEVHGLKLPGTEGSSPLDTSPWLVLRFNVVDGECYGRGRVEEFLGDLRSLEALMQALVEGSAVAAKVLFLLNPGSTTKPATVAKAPNGGIVQGKEGDLIPVQVGKAMDFKTAYDVVQQLERRLSEAFLIMSVRDSERTTAEEVRMTQMELEGQLGGLFSLLTVEFLLPYLSRKLSVLQRQGKIPKLPKEQIKPVLVAGINNLGRGLDRDALMQFNAAVAASFGPEALAQYINPLEGIKRLAASFGIETLNFIRTQEEMQGMKQENLQTQKDLSLTGQAAAMAKAPMLDPTKNPDASKLFNQDGNQANQAPEGTGQAQPAPAQGA
jgi:hypothetical protein